MNSCNFTGRITKDPELRQKADGSGCYIYFCLAVDSGKDKDGNKQTEFIDCITYNKTAEFLANYIKKGYLLGVTGALHISQVEDSEGNKTKRATVKVFGVENLTPRAQETTTEAKPEPVNVDLSKLSNQKETAEPTELPFEI